MSERWRLIDTGVRPAAENMALNRAMLESHQQRQIPHTLRFLRFRPSALLGFHQSAEQELCLEYCREQGIEIQRRITGGGAIYFDESQLGWELYLNRSALGTADMEHISRRICEAAARGISRLGIDARFRPRNDIEVAGRKISGTGGAFDGSSILYQGTLLLDFDVARMLRVLRIPAEKLSGKAISSARERVVNLKELLGEVPDLTQVKSQIAAAFAEAFGIEFETADKLLPVEEASFRQALAEIDTDEWVYQRERPVSVTSWAEGLYRAPGGLLRASVKLDHGGTLLRQVWITGDFFVTPRRLVPDLEAALKDTPLTQLESTVEHFFADNPAQMLSLRPEDFIAVLQAALSRDRVA